MPYAMGLEIGQAVLLLLKYNCIYSTVYLINGITVFLYRILDSIPSSDLFYVSPGLHSTE